MIYFLLHPNTNLVYCGKKQIEHACKNYNYNSQYLFHYQPFSGQICSEAIH